MPCVIAGVPTPVELVAVVGITLVVPTQPVVTELFVDAAPAKVIVIPVVAAAAADVNDAVVVTVLGSVPDPAPVKTTFVAAAVASTFKKPFPLTRSAAPKLTAVAADGALDAKAPLETDALAMFAPVGVIVNASSPTKVVATPAASLKVKRYRAP